MRCSLKLNLDKRLIQFALSEISKQDTLSFEDISLEKCFMSQKMKAEYYNNQECYY